jgi:hypothetical protein
MPKKRKGIFVEEDSWQALKLFCVQNKLNVVDKAGEIVEEWVAANCVVTSSYPRKDEV